MPATATKARRFEGRIDAESDEIITQAASLTGQSKAAFMVASARAEADRVLGRADVTLMAAEQFDALIDSLDEPEPLPVLERALAQPPAFVQL
ncbi:MAG: DUF1778 domain-containing protein [Bifidobacteriaceae bacterium]|jgi:uncharacterized protein (DUF1778 family)|nr:DUF1778 domain-containing protein [Bifidobacteriaceae bacterium]